MLFEIPLYTDPYHFFPAVPSAFSSSRVSGLHLEEDTEQRLGRLREELDLGVGMEAVQVRSLGRQGFVDVAVVALVVCVGWHREARGEIQLAVKLKA